MVIFMVNFFLFVTNSKSNGEHMNKAEQNRILREFRAELRAAMGDRDKLIKLHTVVTNRINQEDMFGEEKQLIIMFREELRELLNCRVPVDLRRI